VQYIFLYIQVHTGPMITPKTQHKT